ncbi:hypothetical protein EDEG_01941 [Edhazardia aedis USNM 41457]|uniref:Uncharacterized protein n=1 Tax=Edhazardia aedis (strain USNM 41457) TaxID=1003232 RepID=J9D7I6_EDHAE|nr:hypothetical protein EDEG_01941 [Edhazardia aedis USNM 41457]|eukprot:EJW03746.1 hypothetical protein EDEG_01941 [Edhazardia aedis USNM 41457]
MLIKNLSYLINNSKCNCVNINILNYNYVYIFTSIKYILLSRMYFVLHFIGIIKIIGSSSIIPNQPKYYSDLPKGHKLDMTEHINLNTDTAYEAVYHHYRTRNPNVYYWIENEKPKKPKLCAKK